MNQPTRLQHIDRSILGPPVQSVPVHTLVSGGVGDGNAFIGIPFECDQADVAVAHGALAEEVDAVFWGGKEG